MTLIGIMGSCSQVGTTKGASGVTSSLRVSRLKQHLIDGGPDVPPCWNAHWSPTQKKALSDFKVTNQRSARRVNMKHWMAKPPSYLSRDLEGYEASISYDDIQIQSIIQESLNDPWQREEFSSHRAQFGPLQHEPGSGSRLTRQIQVARGPPQSWRQSSKALARFMLGIFGSTKGKKVQRDVGRGPPFMMYICMPFSIEIPGSGGLTPCQSWIGEWTCGELFHSSSISTTSLQMQQAILSIYYHLH